MDFLRKACYAPLFLSHLCKLDMTDFEDFLHYHYLLDNVNASIL